MTSQSAQIQDLIARIDGVLSKPSPRLPWVMSGDVDQQRRILEETRYHLLAMQQQMATQPAGQPLTAYGQPMGELGSTESAQQVLQAVLQEMNYLRSHVMQTLRQDVDDLQSRKEQLAQELRLMEAQKQQYTLPQQQMNQQQVIADFLQSLMARLQDHLTGQVAQMLTNLQSQIQHEQFSLGTPAAGDPTAIANRTYAQPALTPAQRLQQIQLIQTQSDQLLLKLDSTLRVIFESLQSNLQSYEDSLGRGLDKMHDMGQQGEAIFAAWVNRLAQRLGQEASTYLQSSMATPEWQPGSPPLPFAGDELDSGEKTILQPPGSGLELPQFNLDMLDLSSLELGTPEVLPSPADLLTEDLDEDLTFFQIDQPLTPLGSNEGDANEVGSPAVAAPESSTNAMSSSEDDNAIFFPVEQAATRLQREAVAATPEDDLDSAMALLEQLSVELDEDAPLDVSLTEPEPSSTLPEEAYDDVDDLYASMFGDLDDEAAEVTLALEEPVDRHIASAELASAQADLNLSAAPTGLDDGLFEGWNDQTADDPAIASQPLTADYDPAIAVEPSSEVPETIASLDELIGFSEPEPPLALTAEAPPPLDDSLLPPEEDFILAAPDEVLLVPDEKAIGEERVDLRIPPETLERLTTDLSVFEGAEGFAPLSTDLSVTEDADWTFVQQESEPPFQETDPSTAALVAEVLREDLNSSLTADPNPSTMVVDVDAIAAESPDVEVPPLETMPPAPDVPTIENWFDFGEEPPIPAAEAPPLETAASAEPSLATPNLDTLFNGEEQPAAPAVVSRLDAPFDGAPSTPGEEAPPLNPILPEEAAEDTADAPSLEDLFQEEPLLTSLEDVDLASLFPDTPLPSAPATPVTSEPAPAEAILAETVPLDGGDGESARVESTPVQSAAAEVAPIEMVSMETSAGEVTPHTIEFPFADLTMAEPSPPVLDDFLARLLTDDTPTTTLYPDEPSLETAGLTLDEFSDAIAAPAIPTQEKGSEVSSAAADEPPLAMSREEAVTREEEEPFTLEGLVDSLFEDVPAIAATPSALAPEVPSTPPEPQEDSTTWTLEDAFSFLGDAPPIPGEGFADAPSPPDSDQGEEKKNLDPAIAPAPDQDRFMPPSVDEPLPDLWTEDDQGTEDDQDSALMTDDLEDLDPFLKDDVLTLEELLVPSEPAAEPPASAPAIPVDRPKVWYLGIDVGTTGISAVLLNRVTCELFPIYWMEPTEPNHGLDPARTFRLPAVVMLSADGASRETSTPQGLYPQLSLSATVAIAPSMTTEADPDDDSAFLLHDFKPLLKTGIPHYSPETSCWEPVLQWSDQEEVALSAIYQALRSLLSTLNPNVVAAGDRVPHCGAVGLEEANVQHALQHLAGVVLGYPAHWPDTYSFNLREAVLGAKLVPSADYILLVDDAIATLLSGLRSADGRDLVLPTELTHKPHLLNTGLQGMTLVINSGAIATDLALVTLPDDLQTLTYPDFHVRHLSYGGNALDQDILCQLLYRTWNESAPGSGQPSPAPGDRVADPWLALQFESLLLPQTGDPDGECRARFHQRLMSSSVGQNLLEASRYLKLTLQQQDRCSLTIGDRALLITRLDLGSRVFLPFIQRLNRELNALLMEMGTTAAEVNQVICTGGTASLGAIARWLGQKLPNATIIQDTYTGNRAADPKVNCLPTCSRVAYGLATLPLHPQAFDRARQQFSEYFLLMELMRSFPDQPLTLAQIMDMLAQRGIDTQARYTQILSLLEGHLPSGLVPTERDPYLLAAESRQNPEYSVLLAAPLFQQVDHSYYRPNYQQWNHLRRYLGTLTASTHQKLATPLMVTAML